MTYHLVVNDDAGSTEEDAVSTAVAAFRDVGADVVVHHPAKPAELGRVIDVVSSGDVMVVCGGDGSLHVAVERARREDRLDDLRFAVIPLGTGNDLARTLGVPMDPAAAATAIHAGRVRRLDLLLDDRGEVCVNALHAGVGVDAAARADGWKDRLGAAAYPLGAVAAGLAADGWRVRVDVDGEELSPADGPPVLLVAVSNGPTVGGGTAIAPQARLDDGQLDVVVVAAAGPAARTAFAAALATGRHLDRNDVRWARGREVTISGEPIGYDVDGEVDTDGVTSRTVRVLPSAWSVVVPAEG